jgi:hypothetical protein
MLVDEHDADILSVLSERVKGRLDGGRLRLAVNNEEVLLGIGASRHMLFVAPGQDQRRRHLLLGIPCTHADTCEEQSCDRVLESASVPCVLGAGGVALPFVRPQWFIVPRRQ